MHHILRKYQDEGIINYYGAKYDVRKFLKQFHAIVLPSYHEGMSNSLLEAAAVGRPILASRIPGCMEAFDEGVSGFGFESKSINSLANAIIDFINLPYEKKKCMGLNARKKVELEFDRWIVVEAYLEEINYALSQ
jgi:galacturonosyltransferase